MRARYQAAPSPDLLFIISQKYGIIVVSGCSTVGSARLLGSRGRRFKSCHPDHFWLGVAQLVARSVRDAEVVSSSLITQTIFFIGRIVITW